MAIERFVYRADRRLSDAVVHRVGSFKHADRRRHTGSYRRREPAERSTHNRPLVRCIRIRRTSRECRAVRQLGPRHHRRTGTPDSERRTIQIVSDTRTDVLPGAGELHEPVQSRELRYSVIEHFGTCCRRHHTSNPDAGFSGSAKWAARRAIGLVDSRVQASMPVTTSPKTSVKRKSRPA